MRNKLLALWWLPLACALIPPAVAQSKAPAPSSKASSTKAPSSKAFIIVESGQGFDELQQAVDAIGAGRGTIRIASGSYRQCAVQGAGRISYVAAQAGGAIFENQLCEGKAGLVLRGEAARIDGVIFQDYRAPTDHPLGRVSALSWDSGTLSIVNSLFRISDAALLGHHPVGTDTQLTISQSSFSQLGGMPAPIQPCPADQACTAGVDIGPIAKFRMTTSHFLGAPLAVRAVQVDMEDNLFEDQGDQSAARPDDETPAPTPSAPTSPVQAAPALPLFAMPFGGVGRIQHNEFRLHHGAQGPMILIAVALDDRRHPTRGLVVKDNRAAFATGAAGQAIFLMDGSGDGVMVGENQLGAGLATYQRATNQRTADQRQMPPRP